MSDKKDLLDDAGLAKIINEATPLTKGVVTASQLSQLKRSVGPKAVLFLPDGVELDDDLQIEVVGLNKAAMTAMVARRC